MNINKKYWITGMMRFLRTAIFVFIYFTIFIGGIFVLNAYVGENIALFFLTIFLASTAIFFTHREIRKTYIYLTDIRQRISEFKEVVKILFVFVRNTSLFLLVIIPVFVIGGYVINFGYKLFFNDTEFSVHNQPSGISHSSEDCVEPENPYNEGSGHYAGYEWGESGKSCGGSSGSFIEGCEEYESQEESYQNCLN